MPTFYKANLANLSCREFWHRAALFGWFHRLLLSFLFLVTKAVRVPHIPGGYCGLRVDELSIADPDTVPPALKANLAKLQEECAGRPLELVFFCRYDGPGGGTNTYWEAALLSADGRVYAELMCDTEGGWPSFACYSPTDEGITVHTTNAPVGQCWRVPPFFALKVLPRRASYRNVVEQHYARIGSLPIRPLEKARMASYIVETSNAMSDYWVQRGVFEPMSHEEIDQFRGSRPAAESR